MYPTVPRRSQSAIARRRICALGHTAETTAINSPYNHAASASGCVIIRWYSHTLDALHTSWISDGRPLDPRVVQDRRIVPLMTARMVYLLQQTIPGFRFPYSSRCRTINSRAIASFVQIDPLLLANSFRTGFRPVENSPPPHQRQTSNGIHSSTRTLFILNIGDR